MFCVAERTKASRLPGAALAFLLILAFLLMNARAVPAEQGKDENLKFRFAFGALVGKGEERKFAAFTEDGTLKTGDRFKMMVELQQPCFVYLIYHNATDGVTMLFPYSLQQFDTDYEASKKYYIPKGGAWFELDQHTGKETFYLLASAQRLCGLEELIGGHQAADPEKKIELARQILAEIRSIKKQHRELSSPAERPVNIGGAIRGLDKIAGADSPDVASVAEEISSTGFYARTLTIDHQ